MRKCNYCLDRFSEGRLPNCIEACPVRALDAGLLPELEKKYGKSRVAEGFRYSQRTQPAVVIRPRKSIQ